MSEIKCLGCLRVGGMAEIMDRRGGAVFICPSCETGEYFDSPPMLTRWLSSALAFFKGRG